MAPLAGCSALPAWSSESLTYTQTLKARAPTEICLPPSLLVRAGGIGRLMCMGVGLAGWGAKLHAELHAHRFFRSR